MSIDIDGSSGFETENRTGQNRMVIWKYSPGMKRWKRQGRM
jgi:hypothetical protein